MTTREVVAAIESKGGTALRQVGSHRRFVCPCGEHKVTVPVHKGHDVAFGTARAIEKALAPCKHYGKDWLRP